MSEQTDVTADVKADTPVSSDIDTQLAEMHTAETREAPETKEEEVKTPEAEKPEVKKVVPLQALHEERRERQRLQTELATQRQMMERVNQRLEMLTTPRPQVPDPNEQPIQYLDHQLRQVSEQTQQIHQSLAQRQQEEQQQRFVQHLTSQVLQDRAQFEAATPDFGEAISHLNGIRVQELMFHGMPEDQARLAASNELDQAALQWKHQGRNPAQMAYEFAKVRGYQPKPAQQPAQEKIEQQKKGVAAARSLGTGGAPTGKLTAEALANMSDEEFSKLTESQFRQAMGG